MDRICTIIAQNYLPQAMALLESIRNIYPDIEFFVLITDLQEVDEGLLPGATVLTLSDVLIQTSWLQDMQTYYDPVELATALKPFLLATLLTEDIRTVTFLDPDILLFSELHEGMEAAAEYGIALAPHRLTPSNIHGSGYSELGFLQYGIFNLGYLSVGQSGRAMLEWWGERLRWFCTRFPNDVVFTDQKWMNFVPALFNFKVIRNFGYDFAPWNIDERPLQMRNQKYFAGDSQLVFIHFSQMSGDLASGKGTDLWGKAITSSKEDIDSLALITTLTNEYSSKLMDFRKSFSGRSGTNDSVRKAAIPSFHHRQKLIQASIYRARTSEIHRTNNSRVYKVPTSFNALAKKMERSSTFNGLRSGLNMDLPKITQRLRNFFQK